MVDGVFCGNLLVLVTFDFQLNVAFGGFCIINIICRSWVIFFSKLLFLLLLFFLPAVRVVVCRVFVHVVNAFRVHFTFNFGAFSSHRSN